MRLAAVVIAIALAAPASAQTVLERAGYALTKQHVLNGSSPEVAQSIASCFVAVMNEAEAAAIVAAPLGSERTQAASMMRYYTDGISCATAVVQ